MNKIIVLGNNNIGDLMILSLFFRSLFFYLLSSVIFRLMGKREIGELSIMDLVVTMFIANVASISIENYDGNLLRSIIPIMVLVLIQVISSYIT